MTYERFDADDMRQNAIPAALGYLLFPVPLFVCPGSRFGRFCANQGLILALCYLACIVAFWLLGLIAGWIPLVGWLIRLAGRLAKAAVVLTGIYFAVMAWQGKPMRFPVVGDYELIR